MNRLLLVVVAPWSQYDLAMLDLLAETFANPDPNQFWRSDNVFIANVQKYGSLEELQRDIPGVDQLPPHTPVVAKWERVGFEWGCGKAGRDLVANTIGIAADDFNRKVIDRVPKLDIAGLKRL